MGEQTVGTCSICGGAVVLPIVWWGVVAPMPRCRQCDAVARQQHGPVIEMTPVATNTERDHYGSLKPIGGGPRPPSTAPSPKTFGGRERG